MVTKTRKAKKVESRYAVNLSMKAWDISDWDGLLGTIEIGRGTFARAWKFKRISWSQLADKLERP
jgi:hypothetical protein